MKPLSLTASSIFCDDIREEVGGSFSLIGVLPDNIVVEQVPAVVPRMAILTRIAIAVADADEIGAIEVKIRNVDGVETTIPIAKEAADSALKDSRSQGSPFVTLHTKVKIATLTLSQPGQITVSVRIGSGDEILAGFIHVRLASSVPAEKIGRQAPVTAGPTFN